jgi:hypothetical protein
MATRGNALPGGGQNVVGRVGGETIAIGMLEQFAIPAHLLVAWKRGPSRNLRLRRCGGWHNADWLLGCLRHAEDYSTDLGRKQKGPGETGAFDISELKTDQRE